MHGDVRDRTLLHRGTFVRQYTRLAPMGRTKLKRFLPRHPCCPPFKHRCWSPDYSGHGLDRKAATLAKRDGCLPSAVLPFSPALAGSPLLLASVRLGPAAADKQGAGRAVPCKGDVGGKAIPVGTQGDREVNLRCSSPSTGCWVEEVEFEVGGEIPPAHVLPGSETGAVARLRRIVSAGECAICVEHMASFKRRESEATASGLEGDLRIPDTSQGQGPCRRWRRGTRAGCDDHSDERHDQNDRANNYLFRCCFFIVSFHFFCPLFLLFVSRVIFFFYCFGLR